MTYKRLRLLVTGDHFLELSSRRASSRACFFGSIWLHSIPFGFRRANLPVRDNHFRDLTRHSVAASSALAIEPPIHSAIGADQVLDVLWSQARRRAAGPVAAPLCGFQAGQKRGLNFLARPLAATKYLTQLLCQTQRTHGERIYPSPGVPNLFPIPDVRTGW